MATNEMYRQLLNQRMNTQRGSALIGGYSGSAMMGGAWGRKPKPRTERKSTISPEEKAHRMNNGTEKMSAERYQKLFGPDAVRKAADTRARDSAYIDSKLAAAAGGRKTLPKLTRALTTAYAREELRKQKAEDRREYLNSPAGLAEKERLAGLRRKYQRNAAYKANFVNNGMTPVEIDAGVKAYLKSKATPKKATEVDKAIKREYNAYLKTKGLSLADFRAGIQDPLAGISIPLARPYMAPGPGEGKRDF